MGGVSTANWQDCQLRYSPRGSMCEGCRVADQDPRSRADVLWTVFIVLLWAIVIGGVVWVALWSLF